MNIGRAEKARPVYGGPVMTEMQAALLPGDWAWLQDSSEPCRVLERQEAWGTVVYQVWVSGRDVVLRVQENRLQPLDSVPGMTLDEVAYIAAGARVADALEKDALVAPLEGRLIPLPHQILALSRAMSGKRVRYLLADEVGLGKTIEAGLIMRELKIRGLIRRVLIVAPTGLVGQWIEEMRIRFGEEFRAAQVRDFDILRQALGVRKEDNIWGHYDQVVCPLDSVKPIDSRRGWSPERLMQYNRERFEDLAAAGWDLVIIDEAHRLAGSTEQVARYQLGEALSHAAPYVLLLSATPHQGKSDSFRRLLRFLDRNAFPGEESITRERVAPYVIRTEKRQAVDMDGRPLFKPRFVELSSVAWGTGHADQYELYQAVTEYVREGYNLALRKKDRAIGFLMVLMQRLVTSSTQAIRRALERRLESLQAPENQLGLFEVPSDWNWIDIEDNPEAQDEVLVRLKGLKNERAEIERLLEAARRCEGRSPDVKAQALIELIRRLQREESDPAVKVLVFTEFVATQEMLAGFLRNRGFEVVFLNGSQGPDERRAVQKAFAGDAQIMVSTEAGGEGLNLQFCHVVINYDLPWNPMRIEQRIGRVDRIGQVKPVRAFNLMLAETVESRVREVLEEKLQRISKEFGVDKLGDVLDSEQGEQDFTELYLKAIQEPDKLDEQLASFAEEIRRKVYDASQGLKLLGGGGAINPSPARAIRDSAVPYWTERMTVSYLRSRQAAGAAAIRKDDGTYLLRWPDGHEIQRASFEANQPDDGIRERVSLENTRVRQLLSELPIFAPGRAIPAAIIPGLSDRTSGVWSLWRVALQAAGGEKRRYFPLFISDEGRTLLSTANMIWDRLLDPNAQPIRVSSDASAKEPAWRTYERLLGMAEEAGHPIFDELITAHRQWVTSEREKARHSFEERCRAIERIGLPQVRQYRLNQLHAEQQKWRTRMASQEEALPALNAVLLLRLAPEEVGR